MWRTVWLWLTVHDCSRPHFAQTNISFSKSRVRLADSICLSRNSPPQRSQREEGGGSTRVRMGFPFARHASERGNGTLKRVPLERLDSKPERLALTSRTLKMTTPLRRACH